MSFPNELVLFCNHFTRMRRHYPHATRLAIAADIGYTGYEFQSIEPDDDREWDQISAAFKSSGLKSCGMHVVAKGVNDDEYPEVESEIKRVGLIIDRLATVHPTAYINFTITSNPGQATGPDYRLAGSATAELQHWERASRIVGAVDQQIGSRGMAGNLYNHVWFMIDTLAAELRVLRESRASVMQPGLALFHAHFHQGERDLPEIMDQPGMDNLGYLALLNGWPKPENPFRTRPLDDGNIDVAGALGLLWKRGYAGRIVSQAYDLGGDAYLTARRSFDYLWEIWERFQRNPRVNPWN